MCKEHPVCHILPRTGGFASRSAWTPRAAKWKAAYAALALLAGSVSSRANIIENGDFQLGNTGFTSAYAYVAPGPNALFPEATYTVDSNPHNDHSAFQNMGDHTSGSGKMMIVNGSPTTGISVWAGSLNQNLVVGQTYDFSAWVASVHADNPAQLTFKVGATSLGTLSPAGVGVWTRLYASFTATEATPAFSLVNSQGALAGNDFAIDDINVYYAGTQQQAGSVVPEPSQVLMSSLVVVGAFAGLFYRRLRRQPVQ